MKEARTWVFLSPHLDDAVYSCGGRIWTLGQAGEKVEIWTVTAGDPPAGPLNPFALSLHKRWNTGRNAVAHRREEDIQACRAVLALSKHLAIPECIYRRHPLSGDPLYASETAIFGEINPTENGLIQEIAAMLIEGFPPDGELVAPWGIGGHVDHRLVNATVEIMLDMLHIEPWRYADFPYILKDSEISAPGWKKDVLPLSKTALHAWADGVGCYTSQISTFWSDEHAMRAEIEDYHTRMGGAVLWRRDLSA